jgi:hypothetical protein
MESEKMSDGAGSALFGGRGHTSVSRGLGEFGLTSAGIEIAGRMPLEAPINADNRRYMIAKAVRSGHRFDRLTALLANPS